MLFHLKKRMSLLFIACAFVGCAATDKVNDSPSGVQKISGKVFCVQGSQSVPAVHATVSLIKGSSVLFSTTTTADGSYLLPQFSDPDGYLNIQASATCGKMVRRVPKVMGSEIKNENFQIKKQ